MSREGKAFSYPKEWLEKVPATVFACLQIGELRLLVMPGCSLADGGSFWDVSIDVVPLELRMPNTKLWIRLDETWNIQEVWKREDEYP